MKILSENMQGAVWMMASMAAFTFGDAFMKALGTGLPLAQILVLRGAIATVFVFFLARRLNQWAPRIHGPDRLFTGLRCLGEAGATYFFLTALLHMPLANLSALMQALPLTVTMGAALFFGEAVGWRRWAAIAVGFVGMLLIVQPSSDGITLFSIYGLMAVLCVTLRDLATRRITKAVPSLTVTFYAAISVLAYASIWSLNVDWTPMTITQTAFLLGASLCIIGGYCFSVLTMRVGSIGFSAPFRYTSLVWALILGWFAFGDWPDAITQIGAGLIVATGLFTLWREREKRQENTART